MAFNEPVLLCMQMEWVGRVVNTVRQMTEAAADPQLTEAIGVARLDGLLVHYAKRALECTVNLSQGTPGMHTANVCCVHCCCCRFLSAFYYDTSAAIG
jgi:hypothetical protein